MPTDPEDEENPKPTHSTKSMADPSFWCHLSNGILQCGKLTQIVPEKPEDVEMEDEDWQKIYINKDPFDALMKPISGDKQVKISKNTKVSPWIVKLMGDSSEYLDNTGKTVCNGVVVVRSLQWPGSYNFFMNNRTS